MKLFGQFTISAGVIFIALFFCFFAKYVRAFDLVNDSAGMAENLSIIRIYIM